MKLRWLGVIGVLAFAPLGVVTGIVLAVMKDDRGWGLGLMGASVASWIVGAAVLGLIG